MSDELKSVVEAMLFGSEKVLTTKDLQKLLGGKRKKTRFTQEGTIRPSRN